MGKGEGMHARGKSLLSVFGRMEARRIQRERVLVAAPETFGGRYLQFFFIEGSSTLVPKPQPSLGLQRRRPMLNLGGKGPQAWIRETPAASRAAWPLVQGSSSLTPLLPTGLCDSGGSPNSSGLSFLVHHEGFARGQ